MSHVELERNQLRRAALAAPNAEDLILQCIFDAGKFSARCAEYTRAEHRDNVPEGAKKQYYDAMIRGMKDAARSILLAAEYFGETSELFDYVNKRTAKTCQNLDKKEG